MSAALCSALGGVTFAGSSASGAPTSRYSNSADAGSSSATASNAANAAREAARWRRAACPPSPSPAQRASLRIPSRRARRMRALARARADGARGRTRALRCAHDAAGGTSTNASAAAIISAAKRKNVAITSRPRRSAVVERSRPRQVRPLRDGARSGRSRRRRREHERGAEPEQQRAAVQRRIVEHEIAVTRGQPRLDLGVALAGLHLLEHVAAQIRRERRVGIGEAFVLADEAAQLLGSAWKRSSSAWSLKGSGSIAWAIVIAKMSSAHTKEANRFARNVISRPPASTT